MEASGSTPLSKESAGVIAEKYVSSAKLDVIFKDVAGLEKDAQEYGEMWQEGQN